MERQVTTAPRADGLIRSDDPSHPANLIPHLCRHFYGLGWVTGTGGGISIRKGDHVFIAPSGVQKELVQADDIFVFDYLTRTYVRAPIALKPSACTPLFLAAFDRGAGCCIHTHSIWAVLVTLLVQQGSGGNVFAIEQIEQIKGIGAGRGKGNLGYYNTLRIPIIDNTAHEQDLRKSLESAMDSFPDAYAVLVRRHGVYVWGESVEKAKTQCESLDYLFQLAVEMRKLGLPWLLVDHANQPTVNPPNSQHVDLKLEVHRKPVLGKRNRAADEEDEETRVQSDLMPNQPSLQISTDLLRAKSVKQPRLSHDLTKTPPAKQSRELSLPGTASDCPDLSSLERPLPNTDAKHPPVDPSPVSRTAATSAHIDPGGSQPPRPGAGIDSAIKSARGSLRSSKWSH